MNNKHAKLIHHRDNILAEVREKYWNNGYGESPLQRLSNGYTAMGDGYLIRVLAILVSAELGIQDECDKQIRD